MSMKHILFKLLNLNIYYLKRFPSYGYSFYIAYILLVLNMIFVNYILGLLINSAATLDFVAVVFYSILFVGLIFSVSTLNFLTEYLSDLYKKSIELDIVERIAKSNISNAGQNRGEVISRISADVENAVGAIAAPMWLIFVVGRIVATFLAAYFLMPGVVLLILPFVIIYGVVVYKIGPKLEQARSAERGEYVNWFKRLKEVVEAGPSLFRVGLLDVPRVYKSAAAGYFGVFKRFTYYSRGLMFLAELPGVLGPNLVFVLAVLSAAQGVGTIGDAVAIRGLLLNLFEPVAHLTSTVGSYYMLLASYRRVAPLLERRVEEVEKAPRAVFKGAVLSYGDRWVLRVEELEVGPGDFVWIRGPSGVGKSTLGKAVCGLVKPSAGYAKAAEGCIYVGNDDYVFDASVWENITLWEDFPEEEVRRAAELAQIDFPLDKKCGEGGSELSEGQRQRVLIARALLRRPRVLVLDEVTSGLDVERERAVLGAARRVAEAVVVISHRPTPGEFANKVVEVRDGVARAGV
ncbi:ABC transporter ATP-binding protein [Pyrobaculum sp. 3827-6]|uniref:ABC transporter ATP-binding protein n=1 Tax=Pyrobaculum sp. 3827-6 TaxID=2983604 RepID=UPI0027E35DFB|nr:ABC transporter ATP-binding protein [Pyrobaculum sp. 3827-6]